MLWSLLIVKRGSINFALLYCLSCGLLLIVFLFLSIFQAIRTRRNRIFIGIDYSGGKGSIVQLRFKKGLLIEHWSSFDASEMANLLAKLMSHKCVFLIACCSNNNLLLKKIDLPRDIPVKKISALIEYEISYLFPWLDESWIRSTPYEEPRRGEEDYSYQIAFLKQQEFMAQVDLFQDLGFFPQYYEMRSIAVHRCLRDLVCDEAMILLLDYQGKGVCITAFQGESLIASRYSDFDHLFYLKDAVSELSSIVGSAVSDVLIYGHSLPDDAIRQLFIWEMIEAGALHSFVRLWTASEICLKYGIEAFASETEAAMILPALGAALGGENE